jgi:hypothetical protein
MLVSREGRVGLLNWRGDVLLNCGFEALQLFSPSDTRIVARQDSTVGLLSERGELLVPFDFAAIESFEAQIEFDRTLHTPQLARVFSCPDNARPKAGVWSIEQGALVVPCQYDLIWSVLLGDGDDYGFMVATKFPSSPDSKDQRFSVGIIRADGSPLVEQRYAWIGEPTSFGKQAAVQRARGAIYFAWSQKRPVEALLAKGRTAVWLTATGEHSKR